MDKITYFSLNTPVFHGRTLPENGKIVGYAAIIGKYGPAVPIPEVIPLISYKHKTYETAEWIAFTPRY